MSTIDTQLSNVNIWEGTLDQIIGANIGENDLAFASDVDYEDKFRYLIMPVANVNLVGKIVQYIGGTNENYIQGAFYKCIKTDEVITPVVISATTESPNISNIVVTDGDNFLSQLTANNVECKVGDTFTFGYNSSWSLWCYPSGTGHSYRLYECMTYDGTAADGDEITFTYVSDTVYKCAWELVKNDILVNSVAFENITGEPRDNIALNTELTNLENKIKTQSIQVTELPEISESIVGNVYQYIGDTTDQYIKGYFYTLVNTNIEYDAENSQNAENMFAEIIDQSKMDNWLNKSLWKSYPTANYFTLQFTTGNWDRGSGYSAPMYIDPELRETAYWFGGTSIYRNNIGLLIHGAPAKTTVAENQTVMRFNIYKEDEYHWANINVQQPVDARLDVFRNIASVPTSLIEANSAVDPNADQGNCVIIGSGSNAYSSSTFNTVILGANAFAGSYGVAVGYGAHAEMSCGVALGSDAFSREGVSIGLSARVDSLGYYGARDRSIAIGYRARIKHTPEEGEYVESIQLGSGINVNKDTFQVWDHRLLDKSSGVIPVERFSSDSPTNGYALTYDAESNRLIWTNPVPEIPEIQVEEMPTPTYAGKVVQYIGEDNGELVHGYFYTSVYNKGEDYYYWKQLNVQPTHSATDYNDISNKPQIEGITLEGDLSLSDLGIKQVALTGSYADLTTKPGINGHPLLANTKTSDLGIEYSDILNAPDPSSMLPTLPSDKDDYDYMLKWDHTLGRLTWIKAIDTHEDLGEL